MERHAATEGTGIGARLRRKEDARFLHGKGNYVSDIAMPGLQDVAFLRSPVAHARIRAITVPEGAGKDVFRAEDLVGVRPMQTVSGMPGIKASDYAALAAGKVRFVGGPAATCVHRHSTPAD